MFYKLLHKNDVTSLQNRFPQSVYLPKPDHNGYLNKGLKVCQQCIFTVFNSAKKAKTQNRYDVLKVLP